jgi:hypothetical protein
MVKKLANKTLWPKLPIGQSQVGGSISQLLQGARFLFEVRNVKRQNVEIQNVKIQNVKIQNVEIQIVEIQIVKIQIVKIQNVEIQNLYIGTIFPNLHLTPAAGT